MGKKFPVWSSLLGMPKGATNPFGCTLSEVKGILGGNLDGNSGKKW